MLGAIALLLEDPDARERALSEGEAILREGCVSHNYFSFYRDAIDVALSLDEWQRAEHYAEALEIYTKPEALPWSEFFIARGRALARHGRDSCDENALNELRRVREEAERVGLQTAMKALDRALAFRTVKVSVPGKAHSKQAG